MTCVHRSPRAHDHERHQWLHMSTARGVKHACMCAHLKNHGLHVTSSAHSTSWLRVGLARASLHAHAARPLKCHVAAQNLLRETLGASSSRARPQVTIPDMYDAKAKFLANLHCAVDVACRVVSRTASSTSRPCGRRRRCGGFGPAGPHRRFEQRCAALQRSQGHRNCRRGPGRNGWLDRARPSLRQRQRKTAREPTRSVRHAAGHQLTGVNNPAKQGGDLDFAGPSTGAREGSASHGMAPT